MEMYEQSRFLASNSPAGAVIDGGWLGRARVTIGAAVLYQ